MTGSDGVWHDGAPAHYLVSLGGGGAAGAPKGAEGLQPASAGVSRDVTRAQRPLFAPGARRGRRGAPKGCNQHPPASHETSPGRSAWALFAPGARRFEANSS